MPGHRWPRSTAGSIQVKGILSTDLHKTVEDAEREHEVSMSAYNAKLRAKGKLNLSSAGKGSRFKRVVTELNEKTTARSEHSDGETSQMSLTESQQMALESAREKFSRAMTKLKVIFKIGRMFRSLVPT